MGIREGFGVNGELGKGNNYAGLKNEFVLMD